MNIDYIAVGKRIREIRKTKKWTQAKLAEKSSVEPSNISHIERAATKVSLPTLVNIANALEVSLDEIVFESLKKNQHIYAAEINELLADCKAEELQAITELLRCGKNILRTVQKKGIKNN